MIHQLAATSCRAVAAAALALSLGMSGPAEAAPVITRAETTAFYSADEIMAEKQNGGIPAEVYGNPWPGVSGSAALAPLHLPASVGGGNLIPARPGRTDAIRMVLIFNRDDIGPDQSCASPSGIGTAPPGNGLAVYAVLCRGTDYFSHAYLRDEAVKGMEGRGYKQAMEQLLLALMPPGDRPDLPD